MCPHLFSTMQQPFCLTETVEGQPAYLCAMCAVDNVEALLKAGWSSGEVAKQMLFDRCQHFDHPQGRCGKCYGAIWSLLNYVCIRNRMGQTGKLHAALNKILRHWESEYGKVSSQSAYLKSRTNRPNPERRREQRKDNVRCLQFSA